MTGKTIEAVVYEGFSDEVEKIAKKYPTEAEVTDPHRTGKEFARTHVGTLGLLGAAAGAGLANREMASKKQLIQAALAGGASGAGVGALTGYLSGRGYAKELKKNPELLKTVMDEERFGTGVVPHKGSLTKEQLKDPNFLRNRFGAVGSVAGGLGGATIGALVPVKGKSRLMGAAVGGGLGAAYGSIRGALSGRKATKALQADPALVAEYAKKDEKTASIDKEAFVGRAIAALGKKVLTGASKGLGSAARAAKPGGALQSAALKGQGALVKGQMMGSKALGGGALGARRLNQAVGGTALGAGALGTAALTRGKE